MFERRSRAYLAKLADVTDAFALESAEVGCNPRIFQVDDAGEGLVEERADGEYREVAGFGLSRGISKLVSESRVEMVDNLQPECGSWP